MVRIEKNISFGILFSMLLFVLLLPSTNGAVLNSNWASSSPTIDGTITTGEWDAARTNSFAVFDAVTDNPDRVLNMWAMNDGTNLYLRFQWLDGSHDGNTDAVVVFFDEDNNGNWSTPALENVFAYAMNITVNGSIDCYATTAYGPGYIIDAGSQDGSGAYSRVATTYVVELAIPIGRVDAEDIQPTAGATIGFAVKIYDNLDLDVYPIWTDHNYTTVTFQLASQPIGIASNLMLILSVIGFLMAITILIKKPTLINI
ncbi:MAG: sugar-binding protein [Candidatus Helarchaeota archaeon]